MHPRHFYVCPIAVLVVVPGLVAAISQHDLQASAIPHIPRHGLRVKASTTDQFQDKIGPGERFHFRSLQVGSESEEVAVYETIKSSHNPIEHAFVVIHGKNSDAERFWRDLSDNIARARDLNFPGAEKRLTVVAPLLSTELHPRLNATRQLTWVNEDNWIIGGEAVRPRGTKVTSFDVVDELFRMLSNRAEYPELRNITLIGHSAGGQLVQRYAAISKAPDTKAHVRYIHVNPSTCVYFTDDRPTLENQSLPSKNSCHLYNTWRYGFEQFPAAIANVKLPKESFHQYIARDVISLVGLEDKKDAGDQSCMATMQGGQMRRNRNLIWFRYINSLARTDQDLKGFPGSFQNLPDWSLLPNSSFNFRMGIIKDAGHGFKHIFQSNVG